MAAAARCAAAWLLVAAVMAEDGHGADTAANSSVANTSALFARIFDVECLESMSDETALEDAEEYVSGHLRDLRLDANAVAALHFIGVIVAMGMGEVPDPVRTNSISVIAFCIWVGVQGVFVVTQSFSIVFIVLSYLSMKEHFGECLVLWNGRVAVLDLVCGLNGPLVPAVLQKLIVIKVAIMVTTQGLGAVGLKKAQKAVIYGVKAPFDTIVASLILMTFATSLLTGAFAFIVPMLPIPCAMLLLSCSALAVVYTVLNGTQRCCNCLCRSSKAMDEDEGPDEDYGSDPKETLRKYRAGELTRAEVQEIRDRSEERRRARAAPAPEPEPELGVYSEAVEWIKKGLNIPKSFREAKRALSQARTAIPRFAYLALFAMAIAPVMLFSTWWAWQAYDGRYSTENMGSMLGEVYNFSCASWTESFVMPSILSLSELGDLTRDGFLSMLEELDAFESTPPEVLLKRSRLLSLLSVPLAFAKVAISALQAILTLCLSEGKGIKTKRVSEGAGPKAMLELGFKAEEIEAAGFSLKDLKAVDCSARELRVAGFSARELFEVGFGRKVLSEGGFTEGEIPAAMGTPPDP